MNERKIAKKLKEAREATAALKNADADKGVVEAQLAQARETIALLESRLAEEINVHLGVTEALITEQESRKKDAGVFAEVLAAECRKGEENRIELQRVLELNKTLQVEVERDSLKNVRRQMQALKDENIAIIKAGTPELQKTKAALAAALKRVATLEATFDEMLAQVRERQKKEKISG
ncbi:MAG: hypothetical protein Q7R39_02440 [Dehalococcoidia bacterium]|nr:hypothetical protein [Dehalococcoidia bacterium]